MNQIAEQYVKLVLGVGLHDADYVDAYHGPPQWQQEVTNTKASLASLHAEGVLTFERLQQIGVAADDEMGRLRHQYLSRQLQSLIARVTMLQGTMMQFDEESQALYDAAAPTHTETFFQQSISDLGVQLPGAGTIPQRYEQFRKAFIIPKEKLDAVFRAAIRECRTRAKRRIALPPNESFVVEYVTNKSWSGYNWFKGNAHSLIQLNTDLPTYIDRAVDLGAHEGYPGHHVYNLLLEENLLKKRGWLEFSVYALFSPQSLIAEGTANYGIEVVFSPSERITFEREVLFPAAGLDGERVEEYYRIHALVAKLAYAGNEAARGYLDGTLSRQAAQQWLVDYSLLSADRAAQRIRFFEQYRSYVINYNLGQDLVRNYIENSRGAGSDPDKRWNEFARLISSPRLPSGLR